MSSVLVTGPTTEPVTLAEAKAHLRADGSDDDDYITTLITTARQAAENYTRRAFITQTWQYSCDRLSSTIRLPHQPIQNVASVTIDGTELSTDNYDVDIASGRIKPLARYTADDIGGIVITYTAGYGDLASDVPAQISQAILLTIGHLYENRESQKMPEMAKLLLGPYRVMLI